MNVGRMRHKVTIEEVTETPDAYGDRTEVWSTYATRWASIEPIAGREYFSSRTENSEASVRIRMRWDMTVGEVTTKHRITYNYPQLEESPQRLSSRVFDIESIINLRERNHEVVFMCREVL